MQLLQSSSVDIDSSSTASACWPCIAMGSNYLNTRDPRLVLADTDIYLLNCRLSHWGDGLEVFSISLLVNHAIVEVLLLIMD